MKKRIIIIIAVAVLVVIGVLVAVFVIKSHYRTSGLNPAEPASYTEEDTSGQCTLTVGDESAAPGEEVEVAVSVKDNPGILGMTLSVNYITGAVTLTDAKSGDAVSEALTFTKPGEYVNNCRFLWDGMELSDDQIRDGDILILTFKVNDDAEPGEYPILLSYSQDDIVDRDLRFITPDVIDGSITVE